MSNQRRVWRTWAQRYGLDPDEVYRVALQARPMETFARVAAEHDPPDCLATLHELEDEDVRSGVYAAFDGASALLHGLPRGSWALVTSNYRHRVRGRFLRTGLPVPSLMAGMTVWGVNGAVAVEGVHRHFESLHQAVPHILAFVSGPRATASA